MSLDRSTRLALLLSHLLLAAIVFGGCATNHRRDGPAGLLSVGSDLPDLRGVDQHGKALSLRDAIGSPIVVYFYPRDGTPGCTTEACAFRDVWNRYQQAKVRLLGVSSDSRESHQKFTSEHQLPFPLIADQSHTWAKAFGVSTRFGLYKRVSFLIGRDGRVAKVYPNVDPGVHATGVLGDVTALEGEESSDLPRPPRVSESATPAGD